MTARVLDACDTVAAAILVAWNALEPPAGPVVAPSGVRRDYVPDIGLNPDYPENLISGRQVYVFPQNYNTPGASTRASLDNELVVSVLTVERYTTDGNQTDAAGKPPNEWVDERVNFVEVLYDLLKNPATQWAGNRVNLFRLPEQLAEVRQVYDFDLLIEKKTFWSQFDIAFSAFTDLAGN